MPFSATQSGLHFTSAGMLSSDIVRLLLKLAIRLSMVLVELLHPQLAKYKPWVWMAGLTLLSMESTTIQ